MSIIETLLVFVGIPACAFAIVAGIITLPGMMHTPRYRPGQPWNFDPVWYLPHPGAVSHDSVTAPASATGGASGEW